MTLEKFRQITSNLPADTIVLIDDGKECDDLRVLDIQYHTSGAAHVILSINE